MRVDLDVPVPLGAFPKSLFTLLEPSMTRPLTDQMELSPPPDTSRWVAGALRDVNADAAFFEAVDSCIGEHLRRGQDLVSCRLSLSLHESQIVKVKETGAGWRRLGTPSSVGPFALLRDDLSPPHRGVLDAMGSHVAAAISAHVGAEVELHFPFVSSPYRKAVEEVSDPAREISLSEARALCGDPDLPLGEELAVGLERWTLPLTRGLLEALRDARPLALSRNAPEVRIPAEWRAKVEENIHCPTTYMNRVPTALACGEVGEVVAVQLVDVGNGRSEALPFADVDPLEAASWFEAAIESLVYCGGHSPEEEVAHPLSRLLPIGPHEVCSLVASLREGRPLPPLGEAHPRRRLRHHREALDWLGLNPAPAIEVVRDRLRELLGPDARTNVPAAFAEWATLPGADVLLTRPQDHCDGAYCANPRLETLHDGRAALRFYSENQGCWFLYAILGEGDDPPVVRRVITYQSDPGELLPFADTFSAAVRRLLEGRT